MAENVQVPHQIVVRITASGHRLLKDEEIHPACICSESFVLNTYAQNAQECIELLKAKLQELKDTWQKDYTQTAQAQNSQT